MLISTAPCRRGSACAQPLAEPRLDGAFLATNANSEAGLDRTGATFCYSTSYIAIIGDSGPGNADGHERHLRFSRQRRFFLPRLLVVVARRARRPRAASRRLSRAPPARLRARSAMD